MGVGPEEAGRLSLWTYTALLDRWNAAHSDRDGETDPAEPPSAEFVRQRHEHLQSLGIGSIH